MNRDASFQDAKRLYLESYGDPMVTNTYLKIALVLVSLVAVGLALVDLRTIRTFENFRPLVIRIDDLGRAEAINYHNFEYKPQDAEAKYFLSQFTKLYYRRNRYTIQDDFAKSLYFLDGKLANGILDAYHKDDIIRKFLTNTSAPEIDVDVKKVALEEMQNPPYRGRIDFYLVYYHRESRLHLPEPRAQRIDPHQSAGPHDFLLPRRPGVQMNPSQKTEARGVAGVRLATSAQPPRATSFFPSWSPASISAQPIPPSLAPSHKRHASGEPRLLRTPARSCGRRGVSKCRPNPFAGVGQP